MKCDKKFFDLLAEAFDPKYHDSNAQIALEGEVCPPTAMLTLNGRRLPIEPTSLQAIALTSGGSFIANPVQLSEYPLDIIALNSDPSNGDEKWNLVAVKHPQVGYHYNPYAVESIFCEK